MKKHIIFMLTLLMTNALDWVKRPNCEDSDLETFSDPLGDWMTRWF